MARTILVLGLFLGLASPEVAEACIHNQLMFKWYSNAGGCERPEHRTTDDHDLVLEGVLRAVDEDEPEKQDGLHRLRFEVVRRFKGRSRETVVASARSLSEVQGKVGETFLVFLQRDDEDQLRLSYCGAYSGDQLQLWLRAATPPDREVEAHLKALEAGDGLEAIDAWKTEIRKQEELEQRRQKYASVLSRLRAFIEAREPAAALEAWKQLRDWRQPLIRGRTKPAKDPLVDLEPSLRIELLSLLRRTALMARAELDLTDARRHWRQVLVVDAEHEEARAALLALDAEANRLLQQAHDRRKSHPDLARAGFREVIRMTAGSSELQNRARQMLKALGEPGKKAGR